MKMRHAVSVQVFFLFAACAQITQTEYTDKEYSSPKVKKIATVSNPLGGQTKGLCGVARLGFVVNEDGRTSDIRLLKSSGFALLDQAAIECTRSSLFYPALHFSKAVASAHSWDLDFRFFISNEFAQSYVQKVLTLYKNANAECTNVDEIVDEILQKHQEFAGNMIDHGNYNHYLRQIIQTETYHTWEDVWDYWPLKFLAFHDLINRYPDWQNIHRANEVFQEVIKTDLQFIQNDKAGASKNGSRQYVLHKIHDFLEKEYPHILSSKRDVG